MAYLVVLGRRRPRNVVIAALYVAFGVLMGTAITFNVRGGPSVRAVNVQGRPRAPMSPPPSPSQHPAAKVGQGSVSNIHAAWSRNQLLLKQWSVSRITGRGSL